MDNREIEFSLELLISAFKYNNFLTTQISIDDILHISGLIQNNKEIEIGFLNKFDQIKKNQFDFEDLESLQKEINLQISTIHKTILSIDSKQTYYAYISDCLLIKYQYCYNRYIEISKHVRYKEIPVFKYSEKDLNKIFGLIQIIASNFLELRVLQKVEDSFAFENEFHAEISEHRKFKKVDKVSYAVEELMISNSNITIHEVIKRVTSEYYIPRYANNEKSEKVNSMLLVKAIRSAYYYRQKTWYS